MSGAMVGGRTFDQWLRARAQFRSLAADEWEVLLDLWAAGAWPGVES